MSHDERGLLPFWTFSIGTCFGVRLRVSCLLPLIAIPLCVWYGWRLGFSIFAILIFSVLIHEIGRKLFAALTGADLPVLIFWPAGGLQPAETAPARGGWPLHFGGWLANAGVCLATLWPIWNQHRLNDALDPMWLNEFNGSGESWANVTVLLFTVNWLLVLINLLPVVPFDGGLFLEDLLARVGGDKAGSLIARRTGWIFATLVLILGLASGIVMLAAIAGIAFVALLFRYIPEAEFETDDERFMGYDFSEGYTSLNRSIPAEEPAPPPTLFDKWKQRKEEARRQQQEQLEREVSRELDRILAKVHENGMESLTPSERSLLNQASLHFRERGTSLSE